MSEVEIPDAAWDAAAKAVPLGAVVAAEGSAWDITSLVQRGVEAAAPLIVAASRRLPKPDRREDECGVDGGYWDLKHATGVRGDWVQSYAIDGVPVVYDSPGPDGMYSVEEMRERCFAGLAACEDAERLAAEQSASVLRGEGATPAPVPVEDAPSASGMRTFDDEEPPFGERITMRNAEGTEIVWNGKRWFEQGYERSLSMHEAWPPANQNYAGPWFEVGEGQQ